MVVNRSIEQGIVTLFVLAMQKGHTPVDSFTLSTVMGVSDSYLRKILQRLSRAGIVISVAGHQGGFVLARPLDQITTGEVFKVLGGEGVSFRGSKAAENAFGDIEGVSDAEREFTGALAEGYDAFINVLNTRSLASLLSTQDWREGSHEWTLEVERRDSASSATD